MKKIISIFCICLIFIMSMSPTTEAWVVVKVYKILDKYSYKIPNLNTSFVPQGLCKTTINGTTYRLITAYDYDEQKNSVIYIIDGNGKHLRTVSLKNTAGQHVGGITEYNNELWVVSTTEIYIVSKTTLINAENGSTITPTVLTDRNILNSQQGKYSFCTVHNNILWIGTFDKKKTSTAYGYKYDSKSKKLKLVASMEVPEKCQGMAFQNTTTVFFSTSYGTPNSQIYKYTIKKTGTKNGVENYKLNKMRLTVTVPSRSQQIYLTDSGNLYVLFESGSKKFDVWYKNLVQIKEKRVVLIDL